MTNDNFNLFACHLTLPNFILILYSSKKNIRNLKILLVFTFRSRFNESLYKDETRDHYEYYKLSTKDSIYLVAVRREDTSLVDVREGTI